MSDSLWPRGLQHTKGPGPSPTPRACSNSCPSSRWCHPTISSSVIPFSSCLQSFSGSGSFPISQFFASGGQSIEVSASVLPMNIQGWFPLGLTGWISLQSKGLWRVFSNTNSSALRFLWTSLVAQMVKHLPAMQETWVWSLGWEDPLEKEMATHSSILVWKIPWMEEPGKLQPMWLQRFRQDWATSLSLSAFFIFFIFQVSQPDMNTGKPQLWLADLLWQSNVSAF